MQLQYIQNLKSIDVRWADATRHIPEPSETVDVVYSSHMVEHLTAEEVGGYLREATRVLRPGGILRTAVPNARFHVDNYLASGDSLELIRAMHVVPSRPRTLRQRLEFVVVGSREHQRMYDGLSLSRVVEEAGFINARVMPPGETNIGDAGELNLRERSPESVFVEAFKPGGGGSAP